jgi:enoyl-CoA hydratase
LDDVCSRAETTALARSGPSKEPVNKGLEEGQSDGLLLEASYFGLCAATEDKKEGTTAFLEKRAPCFQGR